MDEWDTQQAQLDDADEEGAVLALAEGCAAFRAGVAADDDDVELVGGRRRPSAPPSRGAAPRPRAKCSRSTTTSSSSARARPSSGRCGATSRNHHDESRRRRATRSGPRRQHREADRGRCACASCAAIAKFASYPACSVSAPPELIIDGETWRARQHVMDVLDARYGGILVYAVRTEKEKAPCVVIKTRRPRAVASAGAGAGAA